MWGLGGASLRSARLHGNRGQALSLRSALMDGVMHLHRAGAGATRSAAADWAMLWSQRAVDRARGRVNVHRLVAQGLQLGEGAFVSRESHLDPEWPWLITIEDEAVVSPHVVVIAHDASLMRHTGVCRISPVVIGRGAVVGAAAVILPGTRIGAGSVVGAGAVVRGDIPPDSLVVGNPAKVVSDVEKLVAWQRAELARAVTWPFEGWSRGSGIDEQRKLQQWETLRSGTPGFLARRGADRPPRGG